MSLVFRAAPFLHISRLPYLSPLTPTAGLEGLTPLLFQPRIMPNIPSPHHVAMQQQFSTVLFSSPPNPVSLQTFAGLAALSSQQTVTQSQHCTRSPRSKGTPKTVAPQSTQQRTSPTLNSSAVPFIPLQASYFVLYHTVLRFLPFRCYSGSICNFIHDC